VSFLTKLLGINQDDDTTSVPKALEAISAALSEVEPVRRRFLGAFAYLLARVAASDGQICSSESAEMLQALSGVGGCSETEAALVVKLAEIQAKEHGGTQDYLVTRILKEQSTREERAGVVAAMLQVAACDGAVEFSEEEEVRTVARQLGFSQTEFLQALSRHREFRTVLKGML
jgi:uncharacterized tellurite resistance protein B-like protein